MKRRSISPLAVAARGAAASLTFRRRDANLLRAAMPAYSEYKK
ncbi:hypothetical protein [Treponema endosymbiont of Eucomonympha sp.]|nr:hypothetical protein [Treponema endosymbiont of Eucomonympha sp.]